jgi:hypothetical protein
LAFLEHTTNLPAPKDTGKPVLDTDFKFSKSDPETFLDRRLPLKTKSIAQSSAVGLNRIDMIF